MVLFSEGAGFFFDTILDFTQVCRSMAAQGNEGGTALGRIADVAADEILQSGKATFFESSAGTGSFRFSNSASPRSPRKIARSFCSIKSAAASSCFSTAGVSRSAARIAFSRASTSSAVCSDPETAR